MPLIAITGTPGTGKTAAAAELRRRGYEVADLSRHIGDHGLKGEFDASRDTFAVDVDALRASFGRAGAGDGTVFVEGHLSHHLDCDAAIVLRCHPERLAARLRSRGYAEGKVRENVQAEVLDVILCEAAGSGMRVHELDSTDTPADAIAGMIIDIVNGDEALHGPGSTDWSGEMDRWF